MPERSPDIVIRASSFADLLDCPERWAARHPQLGNMRMPSSGASTIGTAVHAGTAVYDMDRLIAIRPNVSAATDAARDAIKKPREEVVWGDFRQSEALDVAVNLTSNYCNDFASYFEFDAVELPMDHLDIEAHNGLLIRFTGHIDRRRVLRFERHAEPGQPDYITRKGICDLKTGQKVVRADGTVNTQVSGAQLATYELLELMATNMLGKEELLPAMIFGFPTKGKHKPAAAEVQRPHRLLIGDAQNKGAIDIAAEMIKTGSYWGNARSMLCTPKYCPKHGNCRWQLTGESYDLEN